MNVKYSEKLFFKKYKYKVLVIDDVVNIYGSHYLFNMKRSKKIKNFLDVLSNYLDETNIDVRERLSNRYDDNPKFLIAAEREIRKVAKEFGLSKDYLYHTNRGSIHKRYTWTYDMLSHLSMTDKERLKNGIEMNLSKDEMQYKIIPTYSYYFNDERLLEFIKKQDVCIDTVVQPYNKAHSDMLDNVDNTIKRKTLFRENNFYKKYKYAIRFRWIGFHNTEITSAEIRKEGHEYFKEIGEDYKISGNSSNIFYTSDDDAVVYMQLKYSDYIYQIDTIEKLKELGEDNEL